MSKLFERMRRAARAESRPVGFTTVATAPQPTMLVIAEATAKEAAKAAEGADALLLPGDADAAIKEHAKGSLPVGVRLAAGDRARVAALREAGVDFVVLDDESAASALMEEDLSYILEVPGEPTDTDLRALETLPLEALLVPPVEGPLTIRRSIGLRRFAAFTRRPLMLPADGSIDGADLEALRELNVLLLLAPASAAAGLRDKVAALPPRRERRTGGRTGASAIGLGVVRVEEHDEDEDDED